MSKRNLLNLALLILIIALITIVIYKPGKDAAIKPPTLTTLDKSNITHLKINRHSVDSAEKEVEFKKTSDGWVMLKPYSLPANTFRIDSILEILSTVSYSQNNLEKLDLTTFGLTKPLATITFNNKTRLHFGHNKSLKNHRYIQIGSILHLTADTFFYQLAAKPESYINHKVLNKKHKIIKLKLPTISLEKTKDSWQVTPKQKRFSMDAVNKLINEWQLSQAYDVNKIKPNRKNKADIIISLDNNTNINFKIENSKSSFNLINLNTGVRYILSSDRKDKLLTLSDVHQEKQELK